MKLCITGSFGNQDIGDDAMLTMHLRQLESLGIERHQITLVGRMPEYIAWYHQHPLDLCRTETGSPEGYDALLVTGGGTVNTRDGSADSLQRMYDLVMPFARAGKPIFMSGQTIGPLGINPDHDGLAKELVEAVDVLTVRDRIYSAKTLEAIGAHPKRLIETTDDAVDLPMEGELGAEVDNFLGAFYPGMEPGILAFNVTTYIADTPERIERLAGVADRAGSPTILIPHHPRDYPALTAIKERMRAPWLLLVDTHNWRAGQIKQLVSECSRAIGGRYHFIVFAGSALVPFLGLVSNEYSWIKQHGFASSIDMGNSILREEHWSIPQALHFWPPMRPASSLSFGAVTEWLGH